MKELNDKLQLVYNYVYANPGCTAKDIATALNDTHGNVHYKLKSLEADGFIHRERNVKTDGAGHVLYNYFVGAAASDSKAESTKPIKGDLANFTPRELMMELKRRGYVGKLEYTKVIDLSKNF